jgi:hypothetical protein
VRTTSPSGAGSVALLLTPARLAAQRLRNTLRANAATSLAAGMLAAVAPNILDQVLGTSHPGWVRLVGIGLIVFAADVTIVAGAPTVRLARWTKGIVAADVMWVGATIATIRAGWFDFRGAVLLGLAGAVVGSFAAVQWRRLRSLRAEAPGGIDDSPPVEISTASTVIEAPVAQVWTVITDHELYGRLAPNLSAVQATAADGAGLTRTCTNRRGHAWHEGCTLWDGGRRFGVEVDTSDYPCPLASMRGAWSVEPDHDQTGTKVVMQFAFQPEATVHGRLFVIAMHALFPLALRRILRGWRRHTPLAPRAPY